MKPHLSDSEKFRLQLLLDDYRKAQHTQAGCIEAISEVLSIDVDRSLDIANQFRSATAVCNEHGIEVYCERQCSTPWDS